MTRIHPFLEWHSARILGSRQGHMLLRKCVKAVLLLPVMFRVYILGSVALNLVNLMITQKCTLRCRDCVSLMPLYAHPTDYEFDDFQNDFEILMNTVSYIGTVHILGGEPFVHPRLADIIYCVSRHSTEIGIIRLVTNATIVPREDVLEALRATGIQVAISDYGPYSRRKAELILALEKCHIDYVFWGWTPDASSWCDCGSVAPKYRSQKANDELFDICEMPFACWALSKGILTICNRALSMVELSIIPQKGEELVYLAKRHSREKIRNLFRLHRLSACAFCDGIYKDRPHVTSGEQIKSSSGRA